MTTDENLRGPLLSSPSIAALVAAFSRAQQRFAPIEKDNKAVIATKSGGHFSYTYADLATVLAAVRTPLAENELILTQPVRMSDARVAVTTLLAHTSGEWIATTLEMPIGEADVRGLASLITYLRRYGAISLLAIAPADEDDDAAATIDQATPAATAALKARAATPRATTKAVRATTKASPEDDAFISQADRQHLFELANKGGWSLAALKAHIVTKYKVERSEQLKRSQYDEIVSTLFTQSPPGATAPTTREPGEEG